MIPSFFSPINKRIYSEKKERKREKKERKEERRKA
jgi:hypothetical protein